MTRPYLFSPHFSHYFHHTFSHYFHHTFSWLSLTYQITFSCGAMYVENSGDQPSKPCGGGGSHRGVCRVLPREPRALPPVLARPDEEHAGGGPPDHGER
jgi:hypothetical protein